MITTKRVRPKRKNWPRLNTVSKREVDMLLASFQETCECVLLRFKEQARQAKTDRLRQQIAYYDHAVKCIRWMRGVTEQLKEKPTA